MTAISAALPPTDGLACFNRMYLIVTERVRTEVDSTFYGDPAFMAALDVTFFNLYLGAVTGFKRGAADGRRVLERAAGRAGRPPLFAPLQFALAGMNADINHDLPMAVVATCRDLSYRARPGDPRRRFRQGEHPPRFLGRGHPRSFETGLLLELSTAGPPASRTSSATSRWRRPAAWPGTTPGPCGTFASTTAWPGTTPRASGRRPRAGRTGPAGAAALTHCSDSTALTAVP